MDCWSLPTNRNPAFSQRFKMDRIFELNFHPHNRRLPLHNRVFHQASRFRLYDPQSVCPLLCGAVFLVQNHCKDDRQCSFVHRSYKKRNDGPWELCTFQAQTKPLSGLGNVSVVGIYLPSGASIHQEIKIIGRWKLLISLRIYRNAINVDLSERRESYMKDNFLPWLT